MQDEKYYKHNKRNSQHKGRANNNNGKTCDFVKAKRMYKKLSNKRKVKNEENLFSLQMKMLIKIIKEN